ncbi:MAG TPA: hypothetical protein VGF03_08280, partial [Bryobacteraceae bacterium]
MPAHKTRGAGRTAWRKRLPHFSGQKKAASGDAARCLQTENQSQERLSYFDAHAAGGAGHA